MDSTCLEEHRLPQDGTKQTEGYYETFRVPQQGVEGSLPLIALMNPDQRSEGRDWK